MQPFKESKEKFGVIGDSNRYQLGNFLIRLSEKADKGKFENVKLITLVGDWYKISFCISQREVTQGLSFLETFYVFDV